MTQPLIPNFNRPEVKDRKQGESNFLWESAYGRFRLALRFFQFQGKTDKVKDSYWVADCRIIDAQPDASNVPYKPQPKDAKGKRLSGAAYNTGNLFPAGKDVKLKFPVGRGAGAGADFGRAERDDRFLADFVAALFGTTRDNHKFDLNEAFAALAAQKKFDDDKLQCVLSNEYNPTNKDIKDPTSGEVLKSTTQYYPRQRFEPVSA